MHEVDSRRTGRGRKGRADELSAAQFLARGGRASDPKLQLVAGRVQRLAPLAPHEAAVWLRLLQRLQGATLGGGQVLGRPLLALGPTDLWRPPLAVTGPVAARAPFGGGVIQARRLLLVAEPAAQVDRLQAYADARVRQVWLLDLDAGWTVAYRSPWAGAYHSRTLWYPGEGVPCGLGGAEIEVLKRDYRLPPRAGP